MTVLDIGELEFCAHPLHVETADAPTTAEYVPLTHAVHARGPVAVLYFPAVHSMHALPSGPVAPALQVQSVDLSLPAPESEFCTQLVHVESADAPTTAEYVPLTHSVHARGPTAVLYFPAVHSMHALPSGPVAPALHVHSVIAVLAATEFELCGHAEHVDSSFCA